MKKKIVNTEDNDKLNAMADVRNYGAGEEADKSLAGTENDPETDDDDEIEFIKKQDEKDKKDEKL